MEMKKIKNFDCIAMKREAQEAIRNQVRGMTPEEEVAFFREGAEEFERRIDAAKQKRTTSPSSAAT
jgi:soluble cytochrome b562